MQISDKKYTNTITMAIIEGNRDFLNVVTFIICGYSYKAHFFRRADLNTINMPQMA